MGSHKLPFYDYALFLWCCLRKPRSMGAILPSSRSLAKLIVKGMQNADQAVRVIELGAGTGGLTSELLKAGVQPQFLCVIELDHNMCKLLRRKYPGLNVIEGSACDINTLVPEEFRGHTDIVVSGMPIRNFDSKTKDAILEASIRVLKPDGALLHLRPQITLAR